jgi:hypothetical protein
MRVYSNRSRTCLVSLLTRCSGCFLAALLLVFSSAFHPAHADEAWSFVQITCAPELGYFSIRRFFVMDLPHMGPYLTEGQDPGRAVVAALQRKNGIFDSKSLQDNPFDCSIPAVQAVQGWGDGHPGYEVRIVGHIDKVSDLITPYTTVFFAGKKSWKYLPQRRRKHQFDRGLVRCGVGGENLPDDTRH